MSGGGISMGAVPDMLMGKDPKKAILDNMKMAALVGTGMVAAPMMAGTAAAGTAGSGLMGSAAGTAGTAAPGLMGQASSFMTKAKPFMDAASTGIQTAQSMMPPDQLIAPPQLPQQMGAQTLQALAQQLPFDAGQMAEMRKKRRMGLLGGAQ